MALRPFDGPKPRPKTKGTNRRAILYVEDEDVNWEIAERKLRDRYDLTRARNAAETFAALREKSFHAILMDIQLANSALNGIQITKILKGRFLGRLPEEIDCSFPEDLNTPVIFVTAYSARYGSGEELKQAGGEEVLTKPVDFIALSATLSDITTRRVQSSMRDLRNRMLGNTNGSE